MSPNPLVKRDYAMHILKCRQQKLFYGQLRLKISLPVRYAYSSFISTLLTNIFSLRPSNDI